ncbi:hypothetical protein R6Q57_018437 [Mikania cordata]
MHFRVLAKALRMSGGDHIHSGTIVGKLEGEREITLGFIEKDRSHGIYFTQDWVFLPGVLPFGGGTLGHPWGNAPGAVANPVALKACVQARNEGHDLATEGAMDEYMFSLDPIEFHLEDEPYKNRIDSYQRKTGLTEVVQICIGQLDGINIAIAVMDFQFMAVVWEL